MARLFTEYVTCPGCDRAVAVYNPRHGDGSVRITHWHKSAPGGDWCRREIDVQDLRRTREEPMLRTEMMSAREVLAGMVRTSLRHMTVYTPEQVLEALDAHAAEVRGAALNEAERQFLEFALDLAADQMAMYDGFTDEDAAALESLHRMADAARPDRVPTRAQITDQVRVVGASLHCVDDLLAAARPDDTSGA